MLSQHKLLGIIYLSYSLLSFMFIGILFYSDYSVKTSGLLAGLHVFFMILIYVVRNKSEQT